MAPLPFADASHTVGMSLAVVSRFACTMSHSLQFSTSAKSGAKNVLLIDTDQDGPGRPSHRALKPEFLSLCILFVLHPVLLLLGSSRGYFPPDAVQYMSFARDYLANGLLFVEFGNSNQGTILPIVYPSLVLLADTVFDDLLLSTEAVSSAAVLLTSIPLYLIARRFASYYFSVVAVLLVQVNFQLCLWAVTPLTEATFILVLACFVYLLLRILDGERSLTWILGLGVCTAIAFLTRQIGLVLIPFALLALALHSPQHIAKSCAAFVAGFLLLMLPYSIALYGQTGLSPFNQQWSDREEITIDQLPEATQQRILSLHQASAEDYQDLVVSRRALRELLDDNSAMFEQVALQPEADSGLASMVAMAWSERDQYFVRLGQNLSSLIESLGPLLSLLFCLSLLTPFLTPTRVTGRLPRLVLGGFVLNYLLALSLLDGLIDRYVLVLLPFMLLNIALETIHMLRYMESRIDNPHVIRAAFALLVAGFALSQPLTAFDLELQEKLSATEGPFAPFRPLVTPGDPVMALSPLYAHLVNGAWRIMPNDSVEDIAEYAAGEGIPWLLVVRGMSDADVEISNYQNAIGWYFDQELVLNHQEYMQLYAHSNDGRIVLFRFLDRDPNGS